MSGPVVTGGWADLSWAVLTAMQTAEHPGCGSLSTGDEAAPEGSFLNNHTGKHVKHPPPPPELEFPALRQPPMV